MLLDASGFCLASRTSVVQRGFAIRRLLSVLRCTVTQRKPVRRAVIIVASAAFVLMYRGAHAEAGGYAELVRQVAPSVVTVLVIEQRESAGQRAVERANAASDYDGTRAII